jgi:hypothetical protein
MFLSDEGTVQRALEEDGSLIVSSFSGCSTPVAIPMKQKRKKLSKKCKMLWGGNVPISWHCFGHRRNDNGCW